MHVVNVSDLPAEVFVIQEGRARYTAGDETLEGDR